MMLNSAAAAIIHECKKLAKEFVIVTFQHCSKESNGAADELAIQANRSTPRHWSDESPSFLMPHLVNDLAIVE
jgi:hypothetical protein